MDISPDAKYLVRGGKGGVNIYEVETRREVENLPHSVPAMYGPVTIVRWVAREAQLEDFIIIATADGHLFVWMTCHDVSYFAVVLCNRLTLVKGRFTEIHQFRTLGGTEILSLAVHVRGPRVKLAVGTMSCDIACFAVSNESYAGEWEKHLDNVEPIALHFANSGRDLLIFGTFDGGV